MKSHRLLSSMFVITTALVLLLSAGVAHAAAHATPLPTIHKLEAWPKMPQNAPVKPAIYMQTTGGETNEADTVRIPGLQVSAPRAILVWSLPVLLLLIAYLIYSERRNSRRKQHSVKPEAVAANPLFDLQEEGRAPDGKRYQLNSADQNPPQRRQPEAARQTPISPAAPRTPSQQAPRDAAQHGHAVDLPIRPQTQPAQPAQSASFWDDEDDFDNELTVIPQRPVDDEATYRVREVERPLIGHLVRTTSDPNLPRELPLYSLNPAPGERRQIHIGRHSKNNTVVINDPRVSREHAVLIQRDEQLYLRDNGSSAGTFLNWKRLNPGEELLLRHNDLISFGEVAYELQLQSAEPSSSD